jgi:peptidoglycan LD-endopeptidase LytH
MKFALNHWPPWQRALFVLLVPICVLAACEEGAEPDTQPSLTTPAAAHPDSTRIANDSSWPAVAPWAGDTASEPFAGAHTLPPSGAQPSLPTGAQTATPPAAQPAPVSVEPVTPNELAQLAAGLVIPVAGVPRSSLHDTFMEMRGDRLHEAIDILAPRGTPVLSAADGRVLRLFNSRPGGLMVYAADPSERFILLYGHMDGYAEGLRDGMPIKRGQVIGYVGTTGNAREDMPHLHFGILRGEPKVSWSVGVPVNPYPLLRGSSQ